MSLFPVSMLLNAAITLGGAFAVAVALEVANNMAPGGELMLGSWKLTDVTTLAGMALPFVAPPLALVGVAIVVGSVLAGAAERGALPKLTSFLGPKIAGLLPGNAGAGYRGAGAQPGQGTMFRNFIPR